MQIHTPPPCPRPPFGAALCACGLVLLLAAGAARAQAPTAADTSTWSIDDPDWTGRPESPEIARKEAGAALVEGRRECARERQAQARAACLRLVLAGHAAAMKKLGKKPARRSN